MRRNTERAILLLSIVFAGWAASGPAYGTPVDKRELEARRDFAEGRYAEAAHIFADLFAEAGDPIFLRNIARCYQKMNRPDEAISNFQNYLARGTVSEKERQEISSYIQEMEILRDEQRAHAPPSPIVGSANSHLAVAAPGAAVIPMATVATETPSESSLRSRRLKTAGLAVGAAGVALVGSGVMLFLAARSASSANEMHFDPGRDSAGKRYEKLQWITYPAGAAALAVGAGLFAFGSRDTEKSSTLRASVRPWPPRLAVEVRF